MKPDRLTKVLLAIIALGIWANLMMPRRAHSFDATDIYGELIAIKSELQSISMGMCLNRKPCGS